MDDKTKSDGKPGRRILPPVYFLIALLAAAALHWAAPIAIVLQPPVTYAGAALIGLGLVTVIHAARLFARSGTAIKPFQQSTALVTSGIYRYTRNPMYLGMVAVVAGAACLFGSVSSFLPVPVLAGLLQSRFIRREEAQLIETFGDQYTEYRQRVRRWM